MIIETRYNVGDYVTAIGKESKSERIKCEVCSNTGKLQTVQGVEVTCPYPCYCGWKGWKELPSKWEVREEFKIYKIAFESDRILNKSDQYPNGISVMAGSSGWVVPEVVCFPSWEEAQAECDRRNKAIDELTAGKE